MQGRSTKRDTVARGASRRARRDPAVRELRQGRDREGPRHRLCARETFERPGAVGWPLGSGRGARRSQVRAAGAARPGGEALTRARRGHRPAEARSVGVRGLARRGHHLDRRVPGRPRERALRARRADEDLVSFRLASSAHEHRRSRSSRQPRRRRSSSTRARVLEGLSQLFPENVPDPSRGTASGAGCCSTISARSSAGTHRSRYARRCFASSRACRSSPLGDVDELLALGCVDRRLDWLAGEARELLEDDRLARRPRRGRRRETASPGPAARRDVRRSCRRPPCPTPWCTAISI